MPIPPHPPAPPTRRQEVILLHGLPLLPQVLVQCGPGHQNYACTRVCKGVGETGGHTAVGRSRAPEQAQQAQ